MKNTRLLLIVFVFITYSCKYDDFSGSSEMFYYDNSLTTSQPQPGDQYEEYVENPFINVTDQPVSTFSIDADGASYANVRRFIQQDQVLPPKGAIRTEELINYFDLDYPFDNPDHPIDLNGEVSVCPWNEDNKLIRIGIQGQPIPKENLPNSNFVFLIDVSGSMSSEDKLELLKNGFIRFANEMRDEDRVAIVTYAGSAGVILQSTPGSKRTKIIDAIKKLGSGGSTAGAEGILTAYDIAEENFIEEGNNRIIIGTDGDFNVGVSDTDALIDLVEEKRETGVFLTVLGVGRGNLYDHRLEQIANHGNGTFEYIDHIEQLKKVFIYDYQKFYTVAKDVKVQVEFNPKIVSAYRLIGYENRLLETEDFKDDKKDAGEIGADQNITALYEIVPSEDAGSIFRTVPTFTIDFRYKKPDMDTSIPLQLEIFDEGNSFEQSSGQLKFVSCVTGFSMLIMDSEYKGSVTYKDLLEWHTMSGLLDERGFKSEFKNLIEKVRAM